MPVTIEKQLFKNVVINIVSVFWRMVIGFIVMPIMIRNLHQDGYGLWVLIMSFTIFGYLNIIEFGIGSSVIKFVAEYIALGEIKRVNQVISAAFFSYLGLGIIAALGLLVFKNIVFFTIFKIPNELIKPANLLLNMMAFKALIDFPAQAISSTLEGFQRYDIWRFLEIIRNTLQAIITIVILYLGMGLVELGIVIIVVSIFNLISSTIAVKRIFPQWQLVIKFPVEIIRRIILFSGKMFAIRINAIVYNGMDKVIITSVLGVGFLTNYSIASNIHSIANRTMSLVSLVLVPTASMLFALNDIHKLQQIFIRATKYTLAFCVPVTLGLIILARPLIIYWIGQEYAHVYKIAQLFLSYLLINSLAPTAYNMLIGMNKVSDLLLIQVISTLINLIISVLLVHKIGVAGVIWGTIIGTSSAVLPYLYVALENIKLKWTIFLRYTALKVYPLAFILATFLMLFSKLRLPCSLIEVGIYIVGFLLVFFSMFVVFGLDKVERIFMRERLYSSIAFVKRVTKTVEREL